MVARAKKIVFQVQAADAADNTANLSDSDPNDDDADPADAEILVITSVRITAGYRSLLNADGALTPDTTILNSWQQNPAGATLRVIVKLSNKQPGDVLSLQSGYDVSKIAPQWDQATGELSLEIGSGTTTAEIVTALELLEFKSVLVDSASTRKVWVFPSLSGVGTLRSRLDEATGLMRYYLLDSTGRLFAVASTFASQSIFFGKHGYLGVPTSDAEKSVYRALRTRYRYIHLAISDSVEEGKWLVTAGPRKGLLFWDHTAGKYGPGAAGSGWNARSNFWSGSNPDFGDYAYMDGNGVFGDTSGNHPRRSIIHHDLWLNKGEIVARLVEVKESSSSPVLEVDFSKLQATSQRPLILTEDHIWVDDLDTRNPSDDTKVDPAKITFRVMGIAGGTLRARADAAGTWEAIPPKGTVGSEYREFTLAQLQDGLVSLLPDAGVSTLTFRIQARDDGLPGTPGSLAHLSDSDPYDDENDADPESVSIRVVTLKEIDAGKEMPVNDDRKSTGGDGALTPDDATLGAWISATTNRELRVFVKLEGGRKGDVLFLEDGHGITSIASSWDWDDSNSIGTLSLQSDGTATSDHFQAVLNALALRSVRFASASFATISVRPDIAAEVPRKDYYARDVLVRESGPRPYVGEQQSIFLRFRRNGLTVLSSSEFFVEDFDTLASNVTIVMRNLTSTATLQKKDNNGVYQDITPESDASLEFTLEELQQGLIAMYLPELVPQTIVFTLEARDINGNWNDIVKGNTSQNGGRGARSFELYAVTELAPQELEVDLQTGYQRVSPFGGFGPVFEAIRSNGSRSGVVHVVLRNAVAGDRLEMRKSVSGVRGGWSHGGHRYALRVSDGTTTSTKIAEALAEVYYRARESAVDQTREIVVSWVDSANTETVLFDRPLANRSPVLRNWGMAARYHDITPAPGATETPLDLGYHPYREYMPEILDNEGEVVRLEVVLVDKAGGMLSGDERVFLSQELLDQVQAQGLVLRELRSSDNKARASLIEAADGKTPVSPEFMSRILQGLLYRHGTDGRTEDIGERREIFVAVFDGQAHSHTHTMEVRLVDVLPNPVGYVNTFIGTAEQSGMGVSRGTGSGDNEAGMTFPGAAYPFGAVRLTPETGRGYGGYRDDEYMTNTRFVVTAFSGPGCVAAEGGGFIVGVGSSSTKSVDKASQESEAGYYKALLRGGGNEVVLEAAASSPRTATMRLTYQSDGLTGFISPALRTKLEALDLSGTTQISERDDHWVVTYNTEETGVCSKIHKPVFYVGMHIGKHQVSAVTKNGGKIEFSLRSDQRAVDIKISMSYTSRGSASRNIDVENPEWTDFEVEKDKARNAWNYYLSKVAVDGFQDSGHDKGNAEDKWSIFYSALYRSLLHMNTASDVDGNYKGVLKVAGKNKNVRDAPSYGYGGGTEGPPLKIYFTNFSGWDVYRSQMALVGLMAPALSQDMAISLLESGYVDGTTTHGDREIPRWTTGYQEISVMLGDPGPPSVSSLFMFGSRSVSLTSILGIFGISRSMRGDIGGDAHHVLEGAASDTAIAQMALWMSQQDSLPHALRSNARSLYVHVQGRTGRVFDLLDSQGYVVPALGRDVASPKNKFYSAFSEGNSVQYTFMNTYDVLGLKQRIDAAEEKETALSRDLISAPLGGPIQAYNDLLELSKKEGLERWDAGERSMALRFLMHFLKPNEGQNSWYAFMGNEVAHSSPFLANWFEPHLTQNAARRVSLFGFRNAPGGLYGNDDLGATSAWYVWTAMGLYPVIPGVGGVTVVAPMLGDVEISVPGGKSVQLRSSSERAQDAYIQSVRRDGRETSSVWLTSSELLRGMELDFQVGADKSTWGRDDSDRPPSYGDIESEAPAGYGSIWVDEGDDATGGSSHSAFDGDHNTAWRFVSESDGSKVLEVDFTSVYAASGLLLRHADAGRTSTLNSDLSNVTVSVAVKGSDGSWSDVATTKTASWIDVRTSKMVHDTRRMLLDFDAGEVEIHGLRLTFGGLDVNEEHGIYEVLAKDGSVKEAARLRSRRSLLEKSVGDDVGWVQLSSKPALFVHGLHEQVQVTAGRVLVLGESHISVDDLDTRLSATGSVDASKITLRVRGLDGGALQERNSLSDPWGAMAPDDGSPADAAVYSFSLADLRAGKIGFLAGDGTNPITFTIQAEDDDGNLSDSDSDNSGDQPSSVRIPVVGLVKVSIGGTSEVNSDGVLTPLEETLKLWRGAAAGGALTILVELHGGSSTEELLLGSHGVTSITSSWSWDAQSEIGTLSLEGDSTATALNFRAMLDVLQLRSAVGASEGYRRILVRPDISGSAFRKDFHVREVKVSVNDVNDAPQAPAGGLADQPVDEDATATYTFRKFTDKEDDAANKDLTYGAKLVVGGVEQDLPTGHWIEFDKDTQTFTFAPLASHVGSHTLRVRGTDSGGLWVEDDFEVVVSAVNDAPEASAVPDRTVNEDATVTYQVLPFTDEDDDTMSASFKYVAQLVVRGTPGALPLWIKFDADSSSATFRTFTFTPSDSSHVGDHTLRVTGTDDGGKSDFVEFKVTVAEVNDVPKKPVAGLADPDDVDEDTSSTYKFDAFTDEETSPLTYTFSVQRVVGNVKTDVSPKWITLVSATRTFTFTPTLSTHAGTYEVTVVATDAGIGGDAAAKKKTEESAEDVFELVVSAVNDAPEASAVPDRTVNEDATVTYQVLPFTDEDDDTMSASFTYVAQLVLSGTPGALPSWIKFDDKSHDNLGNLNPTFRTFTFTPSDSSHVGDHTLRVTGTDDGGKSDFVDFKVTVAEVNDVPKKPVAGLADPDDVDEDTSSTYKFDAFTDEETSAALTYTFSVQRVVERQD